MFISYATADRQQALAVCDSIESRGTPCWISSRDVPPGENYQEAIVQALRNTRAVVLVFSWAANKSDEIKKELSLASRYHVQVIALRLQNVEPSDAFAYELSTRQWIDAFNGWDKSIDSLVSRIAQTSGANQGDAATGVPVPTRSAFPSRRFLAIAAAAGMLVLLTVAGWWLRPHAPAHSMTVRLAGFQTLSADLPATMRDALNSEISAAFNADGVIGVSTAPAPQPGSAPAYALGGTVHRIGNSVRVITEFKNERTGTILWSDSVDYPDDQVAKIPHKVAVDAGIVVRCGLSGASTYRKPLPDRVLKDYMQYCQESWAYGGTKTLLPAQRVVAALPDFSWGWSAVQTGFMQAAFDEPDERRAEQLRAEGLRAAAKALALDPRNSEALDRKTYLIDPYAWGEQESLYRAAIAAKPLDCGCEHYGYGLMLNNVGRMNDAVDQFRAATDMLALWPDSQLALSIALLAVRRTEEAKDHFEAAIDLSKDPNFAAWLALNVSPETGNYAAAIVALKETQLEMPDTSRAALLAGYRALAANDPQQKLKAISLLVALPKEEQRDQVVVLLGALGASHEALQIAADRPWLFWRRSMRGVLNDPAFPAVLQKLRLIAYWKQSHSQPDVCKESGRPSFCGSL
ncbi:TIR domain-containing protein [Sphingomonas sp. G124]|uniref:TIR domain-containing protein n=1 Tax=Sphingomonas cremea TaxID=2904799 RepID=A0A9X1TYG1_9SPHN|nr:TIR domain-containing protein [Sphingomonas cremea]MCF2515108.1 TIR domain-containing protein [Sphingomonas cremea]